MTSLGLTLTDLSRHFAESPLFSQLTVETCGARMSDSHSDTDSDAPVAKKAKKAKKEKTPAKKPLLICPYGAKCYRKNPDHFKEFTHPDKDGKVKKDAQDPSKMDSSKLEPCPFGANCYRKNLLHFAEFSHPVKGGGPLGMAAAAAKADEDSDDTDQYSDEDGPSKGKGKQKLKKDKQMATLQKTYSQMTETERKDLIKKAVKAKENLEKELKETKEQMQIKDREINRLQNEVNTGMLLVEGEKEALEGDEIKYFPLMAERAYKEGSADQVHFRLAESQFYRLLSGAHSMYRIHKVEYVVNPKLAKIFKQAREDLRNERSEELSYPVLAFHGTNESNIIPICETGFKVPGEKGFKHKTDTGFYGRGVYFSEYPGYSMGYISGGSKLLLCQVLMGKVYECTKLIHGESLKSGYDSHTSPCKKELVIFNAHHILPSYIVHYKNSNKEFKYVKPVEQRRRVEDTDELMKLYTKAVKSRKSKIFAGLVFKFCGNLCDTHHRLGELVKKHGGTYRGDKEPLAMSFNILVSTEEEFKKAHKYKDSPAPGTLFGMSAVVSCVREEYVYDCLVQKKKLECEDYAFD